MVSLRALAKVVLLDDPSIPKVHYFMAFCKPRD